MYKKFEHEKGFQVIWILKSVLGSLSLSWYSSSVWCSTDGKSYKFWRFGWLYWLHSFPRVKHITGNISNRISNPPYLYRFNKLLLFYLNLYLSFLNIKFNSSLDLPRVLRWKRRLNLRMCFKQPRNSNCNEKLVFLTSRWNCAPFFLSSIRNMGHLERYSNIFTSKKPDREYNRYKRTFDSKNHRQFTQEYLIYGIINIFFRFHFV